MMHDLDFISMTRDICTVQHYEVQRICEERSLAASYTNFNLSIIPT